jgi:hypothetical protein
MPHIFRISKGQLPLPASLDRLDLHGRGPGETKALKLFCDAGAFRAAGGAAVLGVHARVIGLTLDFNARCGAARKPHGPAVDPTTGHADLPNGFQSLELHAQVTLPMKLGSPSAMQSHAVYVGGLHPKHGGMEASWTSDAVSKGLTYTSFDTWCCAAP